MPVYAYKGVTQAGRATKGFVDAENQRAARAKLRRDGVFPTDLAESASRAPARGQQKSEKKRFSLAIRRGVSTLDLALSTLLAGGIPIVRAMDIARLVANNAIIGQAVSKAAESLTEGATLAGPLRASGEFPPLVIHMVDVGERSGELEPMLAKIAESYDEQVESSITRLTALLEPMLILLMVGIVIVIILAVLLPMLQLTGSIQK